MAHIPPNVSPGVTLRYSAVLSGRITQTDDQANRRQRRFRGFGFFFGLRRRRILHGLVHEP